MGLQWGVNAILMGSIGITYMESSFCLHHAKPMLFQIDRWTGVQKLYVQKGTLLTKTND